ncbi:MAG: farnesyl-diphosphate synthase, partial [Alphaproteobacteria bacterium]
MPSPREATDPKLQAAIDDVAASVSKTMERLLPESEQAEAYLYDAMRYGTLGGGKRLRPFLVMQSAALFNVDPARARRVASALEFVHCYSLVHDDLPAMDNSDIRRGQPSVHRKFDEATAILAGDALQALGFEILSDSQTHEDPRVRCHLVSEMAKSAGGHGMCGGQMLDLIGETEEFDAGTISRLQRLKTGMLMAFACEAGAILGKSDDVHRKALKNYAHDLGLAFQVTDDILDVEADPRQCYPGGSTVFVNRSGRRSHCYGCQQQFHI